MQHTKLRGVTQSKRNLSSCFVCMVMKSSDKSDPTTMDLLIRSTRWYYLDNILNTSKDNWNGCHMVQGIRPIMRKNLKDIMPHIQVIFDHQFHLFFEKFHFIFIQKFKFCVLHKIKSSLKKYATQNIICKYKKMIYIIIITNGKLKWPIKSSATIERQ